MQLLDAAAAIAPEASLIAAPGRTSLSYRGLHRHVLEVHGALNAWGIGRHDRVVLAIPQGAELAAAFLAVAASAACTPLDPSCRADEFRFYLADLDASAVIVQSGVDSPVRQAATERGVQIIDLAPDTDAEVGRFTLSGGRTKPAIDPGFGAPEDALHILYTSGTTARPKRVAVTHEQVCIKARNRVTALELTATDRCLNLLPLYHESGLQVLLGTLASGGSVVCPPAGQIGEFFAWLEEVRPTWYSASPAMHDAILARAHEHRSVIARCPLRFIRSGTGALSARLFEALEQTFRAPVIQTYGMTEVGLICANPLPPRPRKVGSVGVPAGVDVAIMDEAGLPVPPGTVGEVVVRGPNVAREYEGQPDATATAFRDGWFRTGDLGVFDADGYLFLKGRLKDQINRGGQKISPAEVEEVLSKHAAIANAAAFPVPHPTLGEEVAAAVVLHADTSASERELREWAADRLTPFKVPRRILIVEELPTDANGKVRRRELAAHFEPRFRTPFQMAATPLERALTAIWAEQLRVERVGVHDNFFDLGGDSLSAARVCARAAGLIGRPVPLDNLFRAPTIEQLARLLADGDTLANLHPSLVTLQVGTSRPPLFCLHSAWGSVGHYAPLARRLGPDQPVYGVRAQAADGSPLTHTRLEDLAAYYVQGIRGLFPQGPYLLCGYSFGGIVAWEVAQQLRAQGQRVALLALLDAPLYFHPALRPERASTLEFCLRRVRLHMNRLRALSAHERLAYLPLRLRARRRRVGSHGASSSRIGDLEPLPSPGDCAMPGEPTALPTHLHLLRQRLRAAARAYLPRPYSGPVALFLARQPDVDLRYDPRLPGKLGNGPVERHNVPGDHDLFIKEPLVRLLASMLREGIDRATGSAPSRRPVPRGSVVATPQPSRTLDAR